MEGDTIQPTQESEQNQENSDNTTAQIIDIHAKPEEQSEHSQNSPKNPQQETGGTQTEAIVPSSPSQQNTSDIAVQTSELVDSSFTAALPNTSNGQGENSEISKFNREHGYKMEKCDEKEQPDATCDFSKILKQKVCLHDSTESVPDNTWDYVQNKIKYFGRNRSTHRFLESGEAAVDDLYYVRKATNRPEWSNHWEFLMSCIAMSVGLGNVWRFPFAAYENGGGAFLVPYLIVIFLVGQPMYYLEVVLGQFSARNSIRVWVVSPVLTGVGYGQLIATFSIVTYYVVLMALTLFYTYKSFEAELPWAKCKPEWGDSCYSASDRFNHSISHNKTSSSELFFTKEVLRQNDSVDDDMGYPDWRLSVCLILSWLGVFLVMMKGVKSSGKAAYFMAILPYIILLTLLIKTFTLEGAMDGVYFFITPDWKQLYNPQVWYSAVTQVFFSLTVCIGAITMYSSFNNFKQPIYRDVVCVVLLDTVTSLVSGFAIFGILGNLAHEKNVTNISEVIGSGGKSLAFVSFPDAIAKFENIPQVFSVLFFFMLWVLGLGSAVSYQSCIVTILSDRFKRIPLCIIAFVACFVTCIVGHIYITPIGQNILNLVDYFGGTFLVLCLSIVELVGISWIYGLENICEDIEFMTGKRVTAYWRWCWGVITPLIMLSVLGYEMTRYEIIRDMHSSSPISIYSTVCVLLVFGLLQVPIWACIKYIGRQYSIVINARSICQPTTAWGPKDSSNYQSWMLFKDTKRRIRDSKKLNTRKHIWYSLNGYYDHPEFGVDPFNFK